MSFFQQMKSRGGFVERIRSNLRSTTKGDANHKTVSNSVTLEAAANKPASVS
jgi:hypothetical protein